jgi:hypothetical protein
MASLGERWKGTRPTKTFVFWSWVAAAAVTMIVGFAWGGWVTGGTAHAMAQAMAEDAVVKRLAPICVARVERDPDKATRLKELKDTGEWERADYVKKHGWATMPGEKEADTKVAEECTRLLLSEK